MDVHTVFTRADGKRFCRFVVLTFSSLVLTQTAPGACPVAADDTVYVNANIPLTFDLPIMGSGEDFTTLLGTPSNGTVMRVPGTTATVVYTPKLNYHGPDSFSYVVSGAGPGCSEPDGGTISINPCATAGDAIIEMTGSSVTFDLPIENPQSGFTLDALPVLPSGALELVPGKTHTIKFTAGKTFTGQTQFTYSINTVPYGGGACGKSEGTVQIKVPVPVAGDKTVFAPYGTTVTVEAPIMNPGYKLLLSTLSASHGTATWAVATTPTIVYVPQNKYIGPDIVNFSIGYIPKFKGPLDPVVSGSIRINPCAVAGDLTREDPSRTQTFDLPIEPGYPFTLHLDSPAHGTVELVENTTATVTYTVSDLFFGVDKFTYTIYNPPSKSACISDTGTVSINLKTIKEICPEAGDGIAASAQNTSVTINLPVTGKAASLTYTQPSHGTITEPPFSKMDRLIYTPDPGFAGLDSFSYTITGPCGSSTGNITVGVIAPNNCPTASNVELHVDSDTTASIQLAPQYCSDPDGDGFTVWLSSAPAHGVATITPDGNVSYTADDQYVGEDTFTYKITDGNCTAEGTVTATVTGNSKVPAWSNYEW